MKREEEAAADERLKEQPNAFARIDIEKEVEVREAAFKANLDGIMHNMYSGIFGMGLPLSRRVELLKMRYDAKSEAFVECLDDEFRSLKDLFGRLEKSEEKRLRDREFRANNNRSVPARSRFVSIKNKLSVM